MKNSGKPRGSFLTLLELILVLAIVLFLARKGMQSYFKPVMNKQAEEMAHEAGINTANYQSVVSSTKEKIQGILDKQRKDTEAILGQ